MYRKCLFFREIHWTVKWKGGDQMSFYFDLETLEVNGIPFELVKSSTFNLPKNMQIPATDYHLASGVAPQMDFVLRLLRTVIKDKEYIRKNCSALTWYLPAQFQQLQVNNSKAQRALWKDLVRIHDFVRCFSIYLDSCRSSLKRSEDSTSKKLNAIISSTELAKEIKLLIQVGGMEFWQLYQEESACKREHFPSITDALARVVANSDKLYPILPAVYALYILKKMGNPSKITKESLLAYESTVGVTDYRWSANLLLQAKYMGGIIQQQFYGKIKDYLCFFQYKYEKPYDSTLCHFVFPSMVGFNDQEDEASKKQDCKGDIFKKSNTILLPICNVRRLALDLGKQYRLSAEEIRELHQKLPGYLYSTASSKYTLSFSTDLTGKLEYILKDFRKICDPSYYSLTNSSETTAREKEKVIKSLILRYRGNNNGEVSQKDMGKFIKRYFKFWDPVLLTLFCCAPIPMELPSAAGIIPYSGDIRKSLMDTLEKELKGCLARRQLSRTFSDSASVRPLINLSKRTLTLKDAVDLLQQFLDQDKDPKTVLDKFFNGRGQSLIDLWQCCAISDGNISYVYTHLLAYAQELVGHAAIGVYYRAVFLKYGITLD